MNSMDREVLESRGVCCGNGCLKCPYLPKHKRGSRQINTLYCYYCEVSLDTGYEGWFYTNEKLNPYAENTASASLLVKHISCKECFNKLLNLGLTKSKTKL